MVKAIIPNILKKNKILIFFILWSMWISAEFLLGPFSHVRIQDTGESVIPQFIASKIQFSKFGLSYLSDYTASGIDSSAQFFLQFSSLTSASFVLLPGWLVYGFFMFAQRFLASYFTFRLCKVSLKLDLLPSVIAGLLFSFCSFSIFSFTIWHQLGLPALPFIILIIEKINARTKRKYLLLAIFGLFIGYANSFAYFTPFILPFIFIWFFYIKMKHDKNTFINLIIFSFFVILAQSQSIFAVFVNAKFSQRSLWNSIQQNFDFQEVIKIALGSLKETFVTYSIPLGILALTFKKSYFKNGLTKKLLILSVVLIITPAIVKATRAYWPNSVFISGFSLDRLEYLIPFVLALLVAVVSTHYKAGRKFFMLIIFFLIVFSFKIKIDTLLNYAPYRSLYSQPDLINLSKNTDSTKWRVVTVVGGGFRSSYPLAYGLYTIDTYLTLYPKTYHSFWLRMLTGISNDSWHYADFAKVGNRIYLYAPEPFGQFKEIDFEKYYNLDLLSLANVKYIIAPKPLISKNLTLLPSQYRDNFNWNSLSTFQKIKQFLSGSYFGPPLYIYENRKVLPRFFVLEGNKVNSNAVEIIKYSPDKLEFSVEARDNSKFVALMNYYPFWSVNINGIKSSLDYYENTFMAVPIPSGKSHITMEYKPQYKIF